MNMLNEFEFKPNTKKEKKVAFNVPDKESSEEIPFAATLESPVYLKPSEKKQKIENFRDKEIVRHTERLNAQLCATLISEYRIQRNIHKLRELYDVMNRERILREGEYSLLNAIRSRNDCSSNNSYPKNEVVQCIFKKNDEQIVAVSKPREGEAVWRDNDGNERGVYEIEPQRGYVREWLASFVAKLLDCHELVPSTILREVEGRISAVQEWVDGDVAQLNSEWTTNHSESFQMIAVLDFATHNVDRHTENFIIEHDTKNSRPIDHGLAFFVQEGMCEIRSYPMHALSEMPLGISVQNNIESYFQSSKRRALCKEACITALGKEDGEHVFQRFEKRLQLLLKKGKFLSYNLSHEMDVASFKALKEREKFVTEFTDVQ